MKKVIITLLLMVAFVSGSNAQVLKDGDYSSTIYVGEKYMISSFYVANGKVHQKNVSPKLESTVSNDNTTTYTWLNNGGIWSENQTYVFTLNSKNGELFVTMIRVVQNQGSDPWSYAGVGRVHKE